MGIFSNGGVSRANTSLRHRRLQQSQRLAEALQSQAQLNEQAHSARDATVAAADERIQWCVDRIIHLEAEVARLQQAPGVAGTP